VRLLVPGDKEHRIIANVDKSLTVNGVIDFDQGAMDKAVDPAVDEAEGKESGDLAHYSVSAPARRY